jgi:hypothetical protein
MRHNFWEKTRKYFVERITNGSVEGLDTPWRAIIRNP